MRKGNSDEARTAPGPTQPRSFVSFWTGDMGDTKASFSFPPKSRRNLWNAALVLLAAYGCADLIVRDEPSTLYYAGLTVLGGVALLAILQDWRKGVYCFFGWIAFEDLIRKYLGNDMRVYFAKDFLVIAMYLSFFIATRRSGTKFYRPAFYTSLVLFFWYCVLEVFNPASTSIFFGLMGLKLYFFYAPFVMIGYALFVSEKEVRKFFFFNSLLILVVTGFGITQSILGHKFLNPEMIQSDIRGLSTSYRVSPITGLVAYRPTSFFVSAGRFQNYLVMSWILMLGFAGFLLMRKQKGRLLSFTALGAAAAASLMTASRGVFLWTTCSALVIALALIWGASWSAGQRIRVMRAIHRTAIFVGIGFVLLVGMFPDEVASRVAIYSETLSLSSPKSEFVFRSRDYPLQNFMAAFDYPRWPYGYGIGTASLGVQYVTRLLHARPMNIGVENGYGQLVIELGIGGLLLWIALAFGITSAAWRVAKKLKGTPWFPIAFGIFWYTFILLFPMSYYSFIAYQDFVMNAYFWLMLGLQFRLSEFPQGLPRLAATAAHQYGQTGALAGRSRVAVSGSH